MPRFLRELRRRNVHRAALAYLAVAWLTVQVIETVAPVYGIGDDTLRLVILALLIGFLPAMAMSWAFEWSSRGPRLQAEIDREPVPPEPSGRTMDRVIIAVLAVALFLFAADRFLLGEAPVGGLGGGNSVAVLPFTDLTAERDHAWFADGLAEEVLNMLSRNPSLHVAARRSSFRFRDSDLPIAEIAAQLGVDHIVEGSVRQGDGRVRVTAQLVDAAGGFNVWSATFDKAIGDVFLIQEQISSQIAAALVGTLDESAEIPAANPEAYILYLQANYVGNQGSAAAMLEATTLYLQALDIDPDYAPAWSSLASIYANQAGAGSLDRDYGYAKSREAAQESIRVDPQHAAGYARLAWIAFWHDGDIGAALEHMRTALELAPRNLEVLNTAATLAQALGHFDDAIRIHEFDVARSRVDGTAFYNLGLAYKYADRLEAAERTFRRLLQLSPNYEGARYQLGETLLLMGRSGDALDVWADEPDDAYRLKGMALGHFAEGDAAAADDALARLIDGWGETWPSEIAHVHAWRGENDQAFEWLERELAAYGPGGWGEWRLQRLYDGLRSDPRWEKFLERVGVSREQLRQYALAIPELPS